MADPAYAKKNYNKKISVTILGLLLCIVLLEIGIRIIGFTFLSLQEYRNRISIKQKRTYCIMCLGDSMTANTWPRPLEEILNERIQRIKFTVIDKAKPATNSEFVISTLTENLDKYNPDMVIVMMGFLDGSDLLPYGNIDISKKMPFKVCTLARILWYHIVNKTSKLDIFKPDKRKEDININADTDKSTQQSKFEEQEKALKKAIELTPKNDMIYLELGKAYNSQGKFDEAIEMYTKALKIIPKNYQAYIDLAYIYKNSQKYEKARMMFKKVIDLNINPARMYFYIGQSWGMSKIIIKP